MASAVQSGVAHLLTARGFDVDTDRNGSTCVWWSLYTQGSGCAFNARFTGFDDQISTLLSEGEIETAAMLRILVDEGDGSIRCTIKQSGSYYHENSMDVDIEVDQTAFDEDEPLGQKFARFSAKARDWLQTDLHSAIKARVQQASMEAHRLLSDLYLIPVHEPEELWSFTTKRFRVKVELAPPCEDRCSFDDYWDGMEPEDVLRMMRLVRDADHGSYQAGDIIATLEVWDEDVEDFEEALTWPYSGGVYGPDDPAYLKKCAYEAARELIAQAREQLGLEKNQPIELPMAA
jgi:hypothetical protein